jgi:hypothetical protein
MILYVGSWVKWYRTKILLLSVLSLQWVRLTCHRSYILIYIVMHRDQIFCRHISYLVVIFFLEKRDTYATQRYSHTRTTNIRNAHTYAMHDYICKAQIHTRIANTRVKHGYTRELQIHGWSTDVHANRDYTREARMHMWCTNTHAKHTRYTRGHVC